MKVGVDSQDGTVTNRETTDFIYTSMVRVETVTCLTAYATVHKPALHS